MVFKNKKGFIHNTTILRFQRSSQPSTKHLHFIASEKLCLKTSFLAVPFYSNRNEEINF